MPPDRRFYKLDIDSHYFKKGLKGAAIFDGPIIVFPLIQKVAPSIPTFCIFRKFSEINDDQLSALKTIMEDFSTAFEKELIPLIKIFPS
jgi:hypothetical protein